MEVPVNNVRRFESGLIEYVDENYPTITGKIRETGKLEDDTVALLEEAIGKFKEIFEIR